MSAHKARDRSFLPANILLLLLVGYLNAQPNRLPPQRPLVQINRVEADKHSWKESSVCPPTMKMSSFQGDGIEPKPLYTRFVDPAKCYCSVWEHFAIHQKRFRGRYGGIWAKTILIQNKLDIVLSSEEVFTRIFRDGPRKIHDYVFEESALIGIDVGAGNGENAAFFSQILPRNGHDMYFFEPNPANWERLNKTLKWHPKGKLIPKAVSDKPGQMLFEPIHKDKRIGNKHAHIVPEGDAPSENAFKVDVITLDDYFSEPKLANRPVFILESDAEGFDVAIMWSSKDVLSRTRFFLFECHMMDEKHPKGPGGTHEEAQKILSDLGFDAFKISEDVWVPFSGEFYHPIVDEPDFMGWKNCVAIRRDDPVLVNIYKKGSIIEECKVKPL